MANPSIWTPGEAISANDSRKHQWFTAAAGQTEFTLTNFTYEIGTGSLAITVSGVEQRPGVDFTETSSNSFTLTSPIEVVGTVVLAEAFVEVTGSPITITDISTVTYDGGLAVDVLDTVKPFADYAALRAYNGRATRCNIIAEGISGPFTVDADDTTSADNGGTVLVDASGRRWKRDFSGAINVKWFGAKGDYNGTTGTDNTTAIQAALNHKIRRVSFPPGRYRTTASLIIKQDAIIEGCGGSDEIDTQDITEICIDGDFDGMVISTAAPGYYGWLKMSRITINKVGGSTKTNSGFKSSNFAPHVVLEQVACWRFDKGFDIYAGLAQLNSCNARWNNVGYNIKATSLVAQNCYAKDGATGYRLNQPCVYSTLISCASDGNTGNAYEFIGATTGPFTADYLQSKNLVRLQNCGAEVCGRYMYVDGSFDIEVSSPSMSQLSSLPTFAHVESARRVLIRNAAGIPLTNWLFVNYDKCSRDTVVVEGDLPPQNRTNPPSPTYAGVSVATAGLKTNIGTLFLAKTRIPRLHSSLTDVGAGHGTYSTVEKGQFAAAPTAASRLRFRVKVLGNGHQVWAAIKFVTMNTSEAMDVGGMIYLTAQNSGGSIVSAAQSTSADITVTRSGEASPDGYTYRYFDVESSKAFWYMFDAECYCNLELFQADMYTSHSNWTVSKL